MIDRHQQNLLELDKHLKHSGPVRQPLSTTAYVEEVSRHLARIRRPVVPQRPHPR